MISVEMLPIRLSAGVGLALALVALSGAAHQGPVLRAQEAEGQTFIQVLDAAGSPVIDLPAEDFFVRQGGVDCKVVRVELINEPLRLALLVDDAGGADRYFRYLRDGLPAFVDALPETSQVALILLSGRARVVVDYPDGLARVKERLDEFFVQRSSPARFLDGLRETVGRFEGEATWPVVALITTDGPSMARNFTMSRYEELLDQVVDRAVTVHALSLFAPDGDGFQTGIARDLTRLTNGWYATLNFPSPAVTDRLTEMAAEISRRQAAASNQYLVVYERPPDADPNTPISAGVRVRGAQLTLRVSADGRPRPATTLPKPGQASNESLAAAAEEGGREVFWNAGELAFASGNVDEAAAWYEKAHEADPTWGKPLFKLALVALNKGDTETAVKYFEQVVEVDPSSAEGAQAKGFITQLQK